jgi:hypothetical protein
MASAQEVTTDACVATSDGGIYCFDPETGANIQPGVIGVYRPGQDNALVQLLNAARVGARALRTVGRAP